MEFISKSSEETIEIAMKFAESLHGGDVVLLSGELGAGKTTFTKGIARYLGVKERVTSPTFTIVKEYQGDTLALYHMDMYRLTGDITELGLEEYLGAKKGISVVEWCASKDFHARVFEVNLFYEGENARRITVNGPREM